MKPLDPCEEVMLRVPHGQSVSFNPYYGLVVQDQGWAVTHDNRDLWPVVVLWEDGVERTHDRKSLLPWKEVPV